MQIGCRKDGSCGLEGKQRIDISLIHFPPSSTLFLVLLFCSSPLTKVRKEVFNLITSLIISSELLANGAHCRPSPRHQRAVETNSQPDNSTLCFKMTLPITTGSSHTHTKHTSSSCGRKISSSSFHINPYSSTFSFFKSSLKKTHPVVCHSSSSKCLKRRSQV